MYLLWVQTFIFSVREGLMVLVFCLLAPTCSTSADGVYFVSSSWMIKLRPTLSFQEAGWGQPDSTLLCNQLPEATNAGDTQQKWQWIPQFLVAFLVSLCIFLSQVCYFLPGCLGLALRLWRRWRYVKSGICLSKILLLPEMAVVPSPSPYDIPALIRVLQ